MTNEEYLKGLSDAEWDEAAVIEAELQKVAHEGFTEAVGIMFVRTVMEVRKKIPAATVGSIFDTALDFGLTHVRAVAGIEQTGPVGSTARKHNSATKRRGKLAGAGV